MNNEEVATHFVDLLKATTFILDEETLRFLYDSTSQSFPLYQLVAQLVDYPEHMISVNARLATLKIYQLQDKELEQFLQNSTVSKEFLQQRINQLLTCSRNMIDFWKEEREEQEPYHLSNLWTRFIENVEYLLDLVLVLEPRFHIHLLERLDSELIQVFINCILDTQGKNKEPIFPILIELSVVFQQLLEKSDKSETIFDYFFCNSAFCKQCKPFVEAVMGYMQKSSDEMIIYACSIQLEICLNWFIQCLSRITSQIKAKTVPSKSSLSSRNVKPKDDKQKERPVPSIEHLWDRNGLAELVWTHCLARFLRKDAEMFLQLSWRCLRSFGRIALHLIELCSSSQLKRSIVKALLLQLNEEFSLPESAKFSYRSYHLMDLLVPLAGPYSWKDLLLDKEIFHSQLLGSVMKDLNDVHCLLANKWPVEEAAKFECLYTVVRVFICVRLIDGVSSRYWLRDLRKLLKGQYRVMLNLEEFLRKGGILQEILQEDVETAK
ncbi:uncharacterized protein Gasu_12400 [Galdieria sulphuraria]|uniref:FPL domain-containing protein n=1 Tax=Galdieria sulphuraria TaxID=130081 RepID=M2Y6B0_GALSU|nr:uncharacterized protein Gasu_12400 [Galdieria sulphuraria]EME31568.1 hypothetical protein Gasu_12400 [Galdieria sulphuraria]|eukprot:XP_005708088.1 hypothetical protein Gasu_12400 [Galdieria sulphuraria]